MHTIIKLDTHLRACLYCIHVRISHIISWPHSVSDISDSMHPLQAGYFYHSMAMGLDHTRRIEKHPRDKQRMHWKYEFDIKRVSLSQFLLDDVICSEVAHTRFGLVEQGGALDDRRRVARRSTAHAGIKIKEFFALGSQMKAALSRCNKYVLLAFPFLFLFKMKENSLDVTSSWPLEYLKAPRHLSCSGSLNDSAPVSRR